MNDDKISYEEYIPTDKWSLQDWYLLKMVRLEQIYTRLMRGLYGGGVDRRALVEFYAEVKSYHQTARNNMEKHLGKKDWERLLVLLTDSVDKMDIKRAEELMDLLSMFHWESGLSKLSESRPLGDFAYARKKLGIDDDKGL